MRRKWIFGILAAAGVLVAGGMVYYKAVYPYGHSHCCISQMSAALEQYAESHGGKYPAGGETPEASLSMLYKSNYIDAYVLRGMTVSEKTVRSILEAGGVLGAESCGWHYVPGLTQADDAGSGFALVQGAPRPQRAKNKGWGATGTIHRKGYRMDFR